MRNNEACAGSFLCECFAYANKLMLLHTHQIQVDKILCECDFAICSLSNSNHMDLPRVKILSFLITITCFLGVGGALRTTCVHTIIETCLKPFLLFASVATTGPSVYYNQSPAYNSQYLLRTAANVTPTKVLEGFSCKHKIFYPTVMKQRIYIKVLFVCLCRAQYMG